MGNKNTALGGGLKKKPILIHYIYVYVGGQEIPQITKILLDFILPYIDILINYGISIQIFKINDHLLKNKDLIKQLEKNKISKLPALKIKEGGISNMLIGNNEIINYYNNIFLQIGIDPQQMRGQIQAQQMRGQIQPQQMRGQIQPQQMRGQIQTQQMREQNNIPKQVHRNFDDDIDDDNDTSIGENKNLFSKFDKMVKYREDSKNYYNKPNSHSQNNYSQNSHLQNSHSQNSHSQNSHSHQKNKYKSNITQEQLKESPFKEGEIDDLIEDNIITDDISPISTSLNSMNSLNSRHNFANLGDDDANDEQDKLMLSKFWENSN
jgi:hypothetical protein